MGLQTVHFRVLACLCCLLISGCASKQIAHFSIAPEFDQQKVSAISKAAAVRSETTTLNKTVENAKSDQLRVTGFNKRTLTKRETQPEIDQTQVDAPAPVEQGIEFDEIEDFDSIELIEAVLPPVEENVPLEAPKPDLEEAGPDFILDLPPTTEVVLSKDNVAYQTEPEKSETAKAPHLVELGLKPLSQLSVTAKPPQGDLPKNTAAEQLEKIPGRLVVMGESRNWELVTKTWEAPGVAYNPLYFEEPYLERYGYNYGVIQPFLSAGRFFGRIPALPYMMGAYPMDECRYPLGYAQPGDCPPYQVEKLPFSARGVLFESLTVTGLVFLIP